MSKKANTAVRLVSSIMVITLVGKVLGLFRDQFLAWSYGVSMEANAFNAASRIPRLFFDAVFASVISSSFIPVFNEYMQKRGKDEAFKFSNNFVSIIIAVTSIGTLMGIAFAPQLQKLFVGGFEEETAALCIQLLRMMFPMLIFTGIAFSFVGILQSLGEFAIPAAMSAVSNFVIILYYILFGARFGVKGLAIAFIFGWFLQMLIQIPPLHKMGYRFRFGINVKDEGIKQVGVLMLSVMVSTWIQPINIAINGRFASELFDGNGSSIIEFANNLYSIIVGVFVLSVANVIFPKLSKLIADDAKDDFFNTLKNSLRAMIFLLIPMTIGLMCLSLPIVRLIYEWKQFDSYASVLTAKALFFFSIGMAGFGFQTILSRAFYASKNGKTPLITGVVSIGFNIVFCVILVKKMDVGGLALGSSLSSLLSALLLLLPMNKQSNGALVNKKVVVDMVKMLASGLMMGVVVVIINRVMNTALGDGLIQRIALVAFPACVGVISYALFSYVMNIEESRIIIGYIAKILKKGGMKNA